MPTVDQTKTPDNLEDQLTDQQKQALKAAEAEQLAQEKAVVERMAKEKDAQGKAEKATLDARKASELVRQAEAAKAKAELDAKKLTPKKFYIAVHGGPMIDHESGVTFTGVPAKAPYTGWLDLQIAQGKIKEDDTE